MRIGLDILGGDYAPEVTVKGAILASEVLEENEILVLIGDKNKAIEIIGGQDKVPANIEFVHTEKFIPMAAHPYKSYVTMHDASIPLGFHLLKNNKIDVFASAGSTGAMMVGASTVVKPIPGVIRPAIAAFMPKDDGEQTLVLDVGLNPDAKPDVLLQYGIIGSLYAKHVLGINDPQVGLLNIGSEPGKGNLVSKSAYELLDACEHISFKGNVEGSDFYSSRITDVVVTDGFVGNIVLKQAEAFYVLLRKANVTGEFFEGFNYENFGGSPVLGINGNIVIGHGISSSKAIKNMILQSRPIVRAELTEKFRVIFDEFED